MVQKIGERFNLSLRDNNLNLSNTIIKILLYEYSI